MKTLFHRFLTLLKSLFWLLFHHIGCKQNGQEVEKCESNEDDSERK